MNANMLECVSLDSIIYQARNSHTNKVKNVNDVPRFVDWRNEEFKMRDEHVKWSSQLCKLSFASELLTSNENIFKNLYFPSLSLSFSG